jgi:hypothetical protein
VQEESQSGVCKRVCVCVCVCVHTLCVGRALGERETEEVKYHLRGA